MKPKTSPAFAFSRLMLLRLFTLQLYSFTALSLLFAFSLVVHAAESVDLHVVEDGRKTGTITSARIDGVVHVDAAQACRVFGGQPYWYQVSGRLFCSARGRKLRFTVRQKKVRLEDRDLAMSGPVVSRAGQAFVPIDFFLTKEFLDFIGKRIRYDRSARLIEMERNSNIGSLRRRSLGLKTIIELELETPMKFQFVKKGVNRYDVLIPGGVVPGDDKLKVDDGLIQEVRLAQAKDMARLTLILRDPDAAVTARQTESPRKLVVEVTGKGGTQIPEPGSPAPRESGVTAVPVQDAPGIGAARRGERPSKRLIVVDPGHGGKDPGTMGRGYKEKDLNLALAKELARRIEEEGRFEVKLTRETDVFVPLEKRSEFANRNGADLFVSIHVNFARSSREHGFEVYFLSEKASDTEAALVAQFENSVLGLQDSKPQDVEAAMILSSLEKNDLINESSLLAGTVAKAVDQQVDLFDRGVKQAQFYVLHWTRAPAVLVEAAFLSNANDAAKLASKSFRKKMAGAIHAGISQYAQKKEWLERP